MKKLYLSTIFIVFLSFFSIGIFTSYGVSVIRPPPPGPGPPPPPPPDPPELYQPTSPDYDGIIDLHWSEPSGPYPIENYKVYISDSENGNYGSITTTTSRSYTDVRTPGTWWYYVRAYDGHKTSYPSNKVSVVVLPQILPWGVDLIDAEKVWGINDGDVHIFPGNPAGEGVNILVIDTGVNYNHFELDQNVKGFEYDHIDNDGDPMDEYGHGTACAGIIAAEDNDYGLIGVAPKSNIYVSRIFDEEGDSGQTLNEWPDLTSAINWAIATNNDQDPDNDIDIISMSFGGIYFHPLDVPYAVNDAYNEGIVLVAGVGNNGGPFCDQHYPSCYNEVIGVGAVTREGDEIVRWSFSNYMSDDPYECYGLDIVAPGTDIFTTCDEWLDGSEYDGDGIINDFAYLDGTSFSTPMVAGVIALMICVASEDLLDLRDTHYFPYFIREILRETANKNFDDYSWLEWGSGLVNATAAFQAAKDFTWPW